MGCFSGGWEPLDYKAENIPNPVYLQEEPDPDNAGVGIISILILLYCYPVNVLDLSITPLYSMQVSEFLEQVQSGFLQTSWLERLAVLFGIVQVLLSRKNKISNYFFGIIGICLTISVLYAAKLYAEIFLNIYYLVMSVYGLWYWRYGSGSQQQLSITRCGRRDWSVVAGIVVGGYVLLFVFLTAFTDSDVPIMDAFVSSTAWAGMWLLAKRKIENWILLNISNFVAIPLLFYKELYLFACLTLFLFIVAISGYVKWKKIMSTQSQLHVT